MFKVNVAKLTNWNIVKPLFNLPYHCWKQTQIYSLALFVCLSLSLSLIYFEFIPFPVTSYSQFIMMLNKKHTNSFTLSCFSFFCVCLYSFHSTCNQCRMLIFLSLLLSFEYVQCNFPSMCSYTYI